MYRCFLYLRNSKDSRPKACKCVWVANLNDLDLRENTVVKWKFLSFKAAEYLFTEIDSKQIGELLHSFDLAVKVFNFVSHSTWISLILEQGGKCLLTLWNVLKVLLSIALLFFKILNTCLASISFLNSIANCFQIKKLAFSPVVNINVRVLKFTGNFIKTAETILIVWVC